MSVVLTNIKDIIDDSAHTYLASNAHMFKGPAGAQGVKGDTGDTKYMWLRYADNQTGSGISTSPVGKKYIGIATNKNTPLASDIPGDYVWSLIKGEDGLPGVQGPQGVKGDQGISVHHLKGTSTTDPEGDFATAGEDDTYTFYGDAHETIVLGYFVVHNGEDGQDAYEVALSRGYVGTSDQFYSDIMYNATNISVIEDYATSANNSRVAAQNARDVAVSARDEAVDAKDTLLAQKGQADGIASLDSGGRIPASQLPSYVDDVIEVANKAALPVTGETGKLYIVVADESAGGDTSTYRWTGSTYAMVSNSLTGADVKDLYEGNADTNAYTDLEKQFVDISTALTTNDKTLPKAINEVAAEINEHRSSTGEEHTFIDQDVTTTGTPRFDSVQLNGGVGTQGLVSWNTDEETLDLVTNGAVLQVGQEVVVNVRNNTGTEIANGTPVMFDGTLGASGRILVKPMDASQVGNGMLIVGLATVDIPAGEDGKATVFGKIRGIDTRGQGGETWLEGDVLYIHPTIPGRLTKVEPTAGQVDMAVAAVVNPHLNGTLFVRVVPIDRNAVSPGVTAYVEDKLAAVEW